MSAVIVDDRRLAGEGTSQLLEQAADTEVVGQAGSGEEGLGLLERLHPDAALVDVNLSGTSWLDLARTASARWPEVPVLIVSAYDDYAYMTAALEIGVRATC